MKRKVVSVADVNRYVNRLLEEDYVLGDMWISGEVSNCKYHHTGHIYFTLKDDKAGLSVVMFSKDANKLSFKLQEGMHICARTRITLYEKTGAYQGYISEIEQQGVGTLYEAFEHLKKTLSSQGLFESHHKKKLPQYPTCVGIITSQTGAAIKDIIQVARRRNPGIPLYIYPVHVQGIHAKEEIVNAIQRANKQNLVDVLIVGRGGGSIEDLWAFNEECVARAIFESDIPIISGVGHEVDFTISDFVADVRAATPSAAAELVIPDANKYLNHITHYHTRLAHSMGQLLTRLEKSTNNILSRPIYSQKIHRVEKCYTEVIEQVDTLEKAYKQIIDRHAYKLDNHIHKLDGLSPLKTLSRGYSVVTKADDLSVIQRSQDIQIGERVKMILSEGFMIGTVEERG